MAKISVTAKLTAGTHPVHGPIIQGQTYHIEEHEFAPQLFERPSDDWQAPWERSTTNKKPATTKAAKKGA